MWKSCLSNAIIVIIIIAVVVVVVIRSLTPMLEGQTFPAHLQIDHKWLSVKFDMNRCSFKQHEKQIKLLLLRQQVQRLPHLNRLSVYKMCTNAGMNKQGYLA